MGRTRFQGGVGLILVAFVFAAIASSAMPASGQEVPETVNAGTAELTEPFIELVSDRLVGEKPLIYAGVDANNLGWVVALFRNGIYICTGSLIEFDIVLTAAHCVVDQASYSVLLGETNLYASGTTRYVDTVVTHPSYGGSYVGVDLAVLKLASPAAEFDPIPLNRSTSWPALYQDVAALGWGKYSDTSGPSTWLQVGFMFATSSPDGSIDPYYCDLSSWERGDDFCMGGWVNDTVCSGDSGGPVVSGPSPSVSTGAWTLYGVTSYGNVGCGYPVWDAKAQNVGPYVGWIDEMVASLSSGRFIDDDGSIHESDIEWLAESGVTKGCNPPTNDRFCPSAAVTRGQMAAFLRRALALPSATRDYFIDDDGSVFEADINALAEAGITKGCNPPKSDRFCPSVTIVREQMAAFINRAFGYPPSGSSFFVDVDGSIFEADVNAIAQQGVTRGCNPPTNDRYCPESVVSRDQMASFLRRVMAAG